MSLQTRHNSRDIKNLQIKNLQKRTCITADMGGIDVLNGVEWSRPVDSGRHQGGQKKYKGGA